MDRDTRDMLLETADRFFTQRSTENVSKAAAKATRIGKRVGTSTQPYEALTVTVRAEISASAGTSRSMVTHLVTRMGAPASPPHC